MNIICLALSSIIKVVTNNIGFSCSRHREESARWYCNRAHLVEPVVLAHAPVGVAAKRVPPVLKEMAAPLLRAARRRSPAPNSSLPARHRANSSNSSSRSRHHRRSNINIDDTDLTRTDATNAHPLHSPEWPRRRFDILSRREAELIATSFSRGARATLPDEGGLRTRVRDTQNATGRRAATF